MYPLKLPKWPPLVPKMSLSHYPYYRSPCHTIPTTEACVTPSLLQKPAKWWAAAPHRIPEQFFLSVLSTGVESCGAGKVSRQVSRRAPSSRCPGYLLPYRSDTRQKEMLQKSLTRHRFSRLNVLQFPATWMTSIASVGPALVLGYANSPANLLSPSMQLSCELFQHGRHVQEHLPLILLQ